MKVLVSDNLGEIGIRMFEDEEGIDVDVRTGLSPKELGDIIGEYHGLVIRSATRVTAELLAAASNLKVVGRAGIGLDNVDIAAATKRGVVVMNTPGGNTVTTAEHAIAMMLAMSRNIPLGTATLKRGDWEKKRLQGREICNKVLGLVGFGKVGAIVADRARGLKMRVIVHDPYVTPDQIERHGFENVTLEDLYKRADYITIHVPKLKDTVGMIDQRAFEQMKDGVMIVNCARGGIVNEADLHRAITSGKVAGAALDVFETEPPGETPLLSLDQVICTPHLGASTLEAQTNVAVAVAQQIIDYLKHGTILNAVNVPSVTGELLTRLGPYLSMADQMGCLQAQLTRGPLKEVIIEYAGDFQGLDMTPVSTAALKGLLAPALKDDVNFVNARAIAEERGIRVTETTSSESQDYSALITLKAVTTEMASTVSGTIYGKKDARIVRINNFRLELIPCGHLALIYNENQPGAIGSIGVVLGENQINIGQMQVGEEETGDLNVIFLKTDTRMPPEVIGELTALPLVRSVTSLDFAEHSGAYAPRGCTI